MSRPKLELHVLADSTGDTAARVARASATQYPQWQVRIVRHPRLASQTGVAAVLAALDPTEVKTVVFSTIINTQLRALVASGCDELGVAHADLLEASVDAMREATGESPSGIVRPVGVGEDYFGRIAAMEFAIANDDGHFANPLTEADIVLVGVSRSGKTPLSMYLGYLGYRTANIPIIPGIAPPEQLWQVDRTRIVGLTVDPERLQKIRTRRVNSMGPGKGSTDYTNLTKILDEIDEVAALQRKLGCPVINTTALALEEAAGRVIEIMETRRARSTGGR
ncbi:pyruvate, phosphate dikinase/phosphoenolpyruvate synthase regulator [Ornithinimicrobium sp. Arc0846-15]|nr:pyruvate, phosphate dikinase/phosphoenolpyruvate synthase regulator [Ornithinimicrobium laminariae]